MDDKFQTHTNESDKLKAEASLKEEVKDNKSATERKIVPERVIPSVEPNTEQASLKEFKVVEISHEELANDKIEDNSIVFEANPISKKPSMSPNPKSEQLKQEAEGFMSWISNLSDGRNRSNSKIDEKIDKKSVNEKMQDIIDRNSMDEKRDKVIDEKSQIIGLGQVKIETTKPIGKAQELHIKPQHELELLKNQDIIVGGPKSNDWPREENPLRKSKDGPKGENVLRDESGFIILEQDTTKPACVPRLPKDENIPKIVIPDSHKTEPKDENAAISLKTEAKMDEKVASSVKTEGKMDEKIAISVKIESKIDEKLPFTSSPEAESAQGSFISWFSKGTPVNEKEKEFLTDPRVYLLTVDGTRYYLASDKRNAEFHFQFPDFGSNERLIEDFACAW
jgi:hypothetical protein